MRLCCTEGGAALRHAPVVIVLLWEWRTGSFSVYCVPGVCGVWGWVSPGLLRPPLPQSSVSRPACSGFVWRWCCCRGRLLQCGCIADAAMSPADSLFVDLTFSGSIETADEIAAMFSICMMCRTDSHRSVWPPHGHMPCSRLPGVSVACMHLAFLLGSCFSA